MTYKLFPYSGSKQWLLPLLPELPAHSRIVEPYAGSLAFSVNQAITNKTPFVGYEREKQLCWIYDELHRLLTTYADNEQHALECLNYILVETDEIRKSLVGVQVTEGFTDVDNDSVYRKFQFALIRLCCSGLYVGAFTSKKVYPQHKLPAYLPETASKLYGVDWRVLNDDSANYKPQQGDLVFIDPPYLRTTGGYKVDKSFDISHTHNIIQRCQEAGVPFIVTYGTGAQEDFPMLSGWKLVKTKTTSNIQRTGTNVREENLYLSWENRT